MAKSGTARTWDAWGHKTKEGHSGNYSGVYLRKLVATMYGTNKEIIPLLLTEDENGPYRGWIDTGESDVSMVRHERVFEMMFPDGVDDKINRGLGSVVSLSISDK